MLTNVNGQTITRDDIGNMLNNGTYTYTWEHGRELAEMASGDGRWSFTYDANGMRTGKTRRNVFTNELIDSYSYVYNGSQLSQMKENSDVLNFFYDGAGRPAYFTYGVFTYYYVTNLQGDVVAILDSSGTVVVDYHYDAYGVLLQTGGTMAATIGTLNPLTYRGYVYDHETGLYYLQSRYYNPTIRQFISPDAFVSTGQGYLGYNMFAYCGNNPVNNYDPGGTYYAKLEDRLTTGHGGGGTPVPPPSYIDDQGKPGIGTARFGLSNVGRSGCIAVAVYNTLISMGYGRSFEFVLAYYNHNIFNRMFLLGFAGAKPKHAKGFFESLGYSVTLTSNYAEIDALSKIADGCILYYTWTDGVDFGPYNAHFVSYRSTPYGYEYYNDNGPFGQPSNFLKHKKATSATAILIFE